MLDKHRWDLEREGKQNTLGALVKVTEQHRRCESPTHGTTCRHLAVSLLFWSAVIVVSLQQWKAFVLLGQQWAEGNFCCTYTWGLCNQTSESLLIAALTANRADLFFKMHLLIIIFLFIFKVCFMLIALRQNCIDILQAFWLSSNQFSSINSAQNAWHMDNIQTLFCSLRVLFLVFYKLHTGVLHSWEM